MTAELVGRDRELEAIREFISSVSVVLLSLGFLLLMHLFVVLHEEAALAGRFGDTYLRYKATVHRWLIKKPPPKPSGGV